MKAADFSRPCLGPVAGARAMGYVVVAGALCVIAGWGLGVPWLKSIVPGYITMKANTALGFLTLGAALLLVARLRRGPAVVVAAAVLSAIACAISLATLYEYVRGVNLGLDEWLFRDPDGVVGNFPPGRLAPITATNFILLATSIALFLDPKRRYLVVAQLCALFAFLVSFQALVGYACGVKVSFGFAFYSQMALHTAVLFIALSAGLIALEAHGGLVGVLAEDTVGARTARRMVLWVILVPPLISWAQLEAERRGWLQADFGTLLRVMGNVVTFLVIVWRNAVLLHRVEAKRRAYESALVEQARNLERSNAELQRFAWLTSHDLKEPLRNVSTYVELLRRRYACRFDGDAETYIGFVADAAARMTRLVDDVVAFSAVQDHGVHGRVADSAIACHAAVDSLRPQIGSAGARVAQGPLPCVRGDEEMLTRLFAQLVGNAVKFRRHAAEPIVEIGARRGPDGFWTFTVRDNGIGIEAIYAERIFVMFKRLHVKQDFAGSGVGLAMCKRIVEIHGGRIWLEPGSEDGAAVSFTLLAT